MEIALEVSTTAPIVTKNESSFSESSQETKIENISNGTLETAASSEKSVTKSVQSSVSTSNDQKSVVEEVKQESSSSFSSSSVIVDENSKNASDNEVANEAAPENVENSVESETANQIETNSVEQEFVSNIIEDAQNHVNQELNAQESSQSELPTEKETAAVADESNEPQSTNEIAQNEISNSNSNVNSEEPHVTENEIEKQSNESDEKIEQVQDNDDGAEQGGLPTVPELEPLILPAIAPPPQLEVKLEAEIPQQPQQIPVVEQPIFAAALNNEIYVAPPFSPDVVEEKPITLEQLPEISTRTEQQQLYSSKEIEQESIKKQLNEIITDIEKNVQITNDDATENLNDEKESEGKKPFDLQKIFTPANDVDEIKPGKNRKLFASSSFYSPTIHPTVEDQVELARRISHSLSDISNQQSKGQSMYVNRKKRSVKWIHDDGHEEERFIEEHHETKENGYETSSQHVEHSMAPSQLNGTATAEPKKCPLKLVMDPRHVQDLQSSMRQYGYEPAPMSPEFGIELCQALNAPNGKGAELFAKRRKKAEKWVVDGTKPQQQSQTPAAGAQFVPAFSDVGIQRVQHNMKLDQIQEKYINQQPSVKMVRSPWEAALETGNVDNAFVSFDSTNQQQQQIYSASTGNVQQYDYGSAPPPSSLYSNKKETQYQSSKQIKEHISGRDLAYRPSVPQGWQRGITLQEISQSLPDECELEKEMSEIYDSKQAYLELIRDNTPTPPVVEYQVKCGEVETNVYEEPVKELIVEIESRESTPEYQTVPVKSLINTFEQGIFTPPEIPVISSTASSSITSSEKVSKFSSTSTTSTSFQDVFSSESSSTFKQEQVGAPIVLQQQQQQPPAQQQQPQAPAPAPFKPQQQQQQFAPVQQSGPKPYGSAQSFPPAKPQTPVNFSKPQTPVSFAKPQTPVSFAKPQTPTPVVAKPQTPTPIAKPIQQQQQQPPAISPAPMKPLTPISMGHSPRSGLNASPVTPGILKKQMQLDAAVPIPPGGLLSSQSPISGMRTSGKSPVPFINTAPAPFSSQFPALSVQTPETIAQIAPNETPLVPPLKDPAQIPVPVIVNTPLPKYTTCYNNAARPFNEFKDYYRPIHMEEGKKMLPPLIYTDF